ncbi:MAG: hypothetical protein LBK60_06735, partial [Verrucomicrobiales bacterium]|nr:hypothetical protein [Verrucomicrobiales bacterium]
MARRSEFLNDKIHQSRTPSITDIWKNLVKRGLYGKGKGYEKTSFTLNNGKEFQIDLRLTAIKPGSLLLAITAHQSWLQQTVDFINGDGGKA